MASSWSAENSPGKDLSLYFLTGSLMSSPD